jgi:hypothetical protein
MAAKAMVPVEALPRSTTPGSDPRNTLTSLHFGCLKGTLFRLEGHFRQCFRGRM